MQVFVLALVMVPPLLVAIYTFNYARWAWRQNLRRGAVGLFFLASASLLVPIFALWQTR